VCLTKNRKTLSVKDNDNLIIERPTFVTHLECAMTGERVAPDRLHNLSPAGFPLLVRYDLDGAGRRLTRTTFPKPGNRSWCATTSLG